MTQNELGARVSDNTLDVPACQLCETLFKERDLIYDCPIRGRSQWAHMCGGCAEKFGQPSMGTVHIKKTPPSDA